MGDIMYTVEKIEKDIVTLEDRNKKDFFDVDKNILPSNIKEGVLLDLVDGEYIINESLTKETKKNIRNRFNSLMN